MQWAGSQAKVGPRAGSNTPPLACSYILPLLAASAQQKVGALIINYSSNYLTNE